MEQSATLTKKVEAVEQKFEREVNGSLDVELSVGTW
jgi:hypothetical protein